MVVFCSNITEFTILCAKLRSMRQQALVQVEHGNGASSMVP